MKWIFKTTKIQETTGKKLKKFLKAINKDNSPKLKEYDIVDEAICEYIRERT